SHLPYYRQLFDLKFRIFVYQATDIVEAYDVVELEILVRKTYPLHRDQVIPKVANQLGKAANQIVVLDIVKMQQLIALAITPGSKPSVLQVDTQLVSMLDKKSLLEVFADSLQNDEQEEIDMVGFWLNSNANKGEKTQQVHKMLRPYCVFLSKLKQKKN